MPESIQIFFDFLIQFTGDGGGHRPGITSYGFSAVFWLMLLLISRFKYKSETNSHQGLLTWGFSIALTRELFMLSVKILEGYSVFSIESLHIFFPPLEHALSDGSEILIAAAYMLFLTGKKATVLRYLKGGLISVVVIYLATFYWWGQYIVAHPESKFGQVWCDWVFRINASLWLGYAVWFLFIRAKGWVRNWVCIALLFFFLDDFLKIPDMALDEVYEKQFAPIRHGLHLIALPILAYIYTRLQASSIKSAFDSLEQTIEERTADLKLASERLEIALERQIQFTADASHELRTPLSIILNEVQWALNEKREGKIYRGSFASCEIAAKHMRGLIESLLELARIDSGEQQLLKEYHELREELQEVLLLLEPIARRQKITLNFEEMQEDVIGEVDLQKFRQIIMNLLSNAIQHSEGNTHVWIQLSETSDEIRITIRDEGAGIAKDEIPRIFDRFYRSSKARAQVKGGSGLGLAVSRAIALAHGGDLSVSSRVGEGSCFVLTLPRLSRGLD